MGPSGQEDPEGSGQRWGAVRAGHGPPLEGDASWGLRRQLGRGVERGQAASPHLQLCSLDRGLCHRVLLLAAPCAIPPHPGRMQDWLERLAGPSALGVRRSTPRL